MGTNSATHDPDCTVFSRMWRASNHNIRAILLNYGAIHCSCTEVLSHSEMTQSPSVPYAGSCKGGCDRHQLSMSNYYSKEKVDAGQRPNIDKRDVKQNAWHRILTIKYGALDNASYALNEHRDQRWNEDKAIIEQITRPSRASPKLIMF